MSNHRIPGVRLLCALTIGLCTAAGTTLANDGSSDGLWSAVAEASIARGPAARQINPSRYRTLGLNRSQMQARLAQAALEAQVAVARSNATLSLPMPDGQYQSFRVVESPIMEDELAAKYPQIRTYLGQGIDDPTATLRFDVTPKGLHAQILSSKGTVYIDPFQGGDVDHYISYRKHDLDTGKQLHCGVTGDDSVQTLPSHIQQSMRAKAAGETLRTYRLAMAATGEYTGFHGGTVLDGLSAIVTTMNRVNGIYEREVSVRMVLVANNDQIVYTNAATDPYANSSGDLNANQTNITNVIGAANYDIGHLVGTGGGGIAQLGSVCGASKARGLTGSPQPIGDAFDIDYVAHEMGHQFDGDHTFNGSGVNCAGNIGPTAYEVGSGVTIQAYAGICGNDDLQPNSEDYFHRVSLDQLLAFTTSGAGAGCGSTTPTGNLPPLITPVADFTIPQQTPFALTATAVDPNGDALTYVWEQFDLGSPNAEGVLVDAGSGPLFRSFAPTSSPTRVFPSLRYILDDANAVPQFAPAEGTPSPDWFAGELLPSTNRTLTFHVTARDNRAGGGGTMNEATTLTVTTSAGPFVVTAPNTAISVAAGANTTVTWNVANTTAAGVNVANVRISLSLDGGYSWPTELLASTANDGSADVTIPANTPASNQARVRVEAVGNIFFDVSDSNFAITGANTPPTISDPTGSVATRQGSPTASGVVATISDAQDAAANLGVAITGAPPELAVSVQNNNGEVSLNATAACTLVAPSSNSKVYPLLLTVTDTNNGVSSAAVNVSVASNETPSIGQYANRNVTQSSTTVLTPSALVVDGNSNLAATTVSPTTLPGGGTIAVAADGVVTVTTAAGTTFGVYTVTVEASDSCGAVERRSFTIQVSAPAATLALASTELTSGNALIEPNECNALDVVLRNDGNIPATAVTATLSTLNANASITTASTSFADIPPGESRTSLTPLQISTTGAAQCFTNLDLVLTVTFTAAAGNSPLVENFALPIGRVAGTNYEFTASSGATIPAGGVLLAGSQTDDNLTTLAVPAGFSTSIYGTVVGTGGLASVRVGANGNLQLIANNGATDYENTFLPATGAGTGNARFPATPTLFPFWDDLNLGTASDGVTDGGVFTQLVGTAPNRTWIIEWRGERWGNPATLSTIRFAIELKEGSNEFAYVYTNPAGAMGSSATIGVQAARTGTVFTQYSLNNASVSGGTRLSAAIPAAVCTSGAGGCSAPAGVTIVESGGSTDVVEGGATDSYTVVLDSAPSADVTITINPGAQVTVAPNPLTFTTANSSSPQTVTVTAVDDVVNEGPHTGTIGHSASGGGYDAVLVPGVIANITDNEGDVLFLDGFEL